MWVGTQQFSNYTDFYPFQGKLYWIAIPTVGGFVVGFLRLLVGYPEKIKSIFTEMNTCHVEYIWGRYTLWLSLISLSCGASLGPEAGLVCYNIYAHLYTHVF